MTSDPLICCISYIKTTEKRIMINGQQDTQSTHITNCWSQIETKKDYIKFNELDMMYGDDATAQVISTYSFVTSVKQLSPASLLIDPQFLR